MCIEGQFTQWKCFLIAIAKSHARHMFWKMFIDLFLLMYVLVKKWLMKTYLPNYFSRWQVTAWHSHISLDEEKGATLQGRLDLQTFILEANTLRRDWIQTVKKKKGGVVPSSVFQQSSWPGVFCCYCLLSLRSHFIAPPHFLSLNPPCGIFFSLFIFP